MAGPRRAELDAGGLFHAASSAARVRPVLAPVPDPAGRPPAFRSYPGAHRTPLGGADLALDLPLAAALAARRSTRAFAPEPPQAEVVGALLRAAAGVRALRGATQERAYPSAGGLYPLELYAATRGLEAIPDAIHHYAPREHELELCRAGRFGPVLADATIGQEMLAAAPLVLAICAIARRSTFKYGQRGWRYVWMEAGHLAAHLGLVAAALGLGAVEVGGFFDGELDALLGLPDDEVTLLLLAVGRPA
jgi:SagB-type dehydrogenase family enzyme